MIDTRYLNFRIENRGGAYFVQFQADDSPSIEEPFEFEVKPEGRLSQVIRRIEEDRCSGDDLRDVGTQLWAGLTSGKVKTAVGQEREDKTSFFQVRLKLPPELEYLPWETLCDEAGAFLAEYSRYCVIRDTDADGTTWSPKAEQVSLVQLLAAVPEGSGLQVETELKNLQTIVAKLANVGFRPLRGRVTPDLLAEGIKSCRDGIFHFIGHGEIDDNEHVKIRLNGDNVLNFWIDAEPFSANFTDSDLVLAVFNCCKGGQASTRRSFGAIGKLLRWKGIPAVVAMRYDVGDDVAIRFSNAFYNALFEGPDAGRVDVALQTARRTLYRNSTEDTKRGFITPVLYHVRGHYKLFSPVSLQTSVRPRVLSIEPIRLPKALVEATRKGRCIPVVGANVVSLPRDRSTSTDLPLRALIENLANASQYPDPSMLELAERAGFSEVVFQSVAEHFADERKRYSLIEAIQDLCSGLSPSPAHLTLATWPTPALFYTHFDGLMEVAFQQQQRTPITIYRLDAPSDVRKGQVLILVRGTITDSTSIVLTERDHDNLSDVIDRLPPTIEQLTTSQLGRSVLLLGVNPRDPIVRKLSKKLIKPGGTQGPSYFVSPDFTAADVAYWKALDVEWVRAEPQEVIASLTAALHE